MSRLADTAVRTGSRSVLYAILSLVLIAPAHAGSLDGSAIDEAMRSLGRMPTSVEIKAWDIDVRPDFSGLPPGQGSVDDGMVIWESKCASCHGVFGESNEVFTPLVGGVTDEDVATGHVAALADGSHPHRTTLMRLSQISTLWDYINRAMPWNAPKSLQPDEVYAVIAYMLQLGELVEPDFVLSNENMAEIQARLPNRNGMRRYDAMWVVAGKPDVQGDACMSDCAHDTDVQSFIPDYARNAHGNLATQNRLIGPAVGVDTTLPAPVSLAESRTMAAHSLRAAQADQQAPSAAQIATGNSPAAAPRNQDAARMRELAQGKGCLACHGIDKKILGPAFTDVAERYRNQNGAADILAERIRGGTQGAWGPVPMPANANVSSADAQALAAWVLEH